MSDEHPLTLELTSLRAALDKYQHAAHVSSLQLQRAHLDVSDASAHSKSLEAENDRLKHEIAVLRANPEPTDVPRQITEFTLALRRVSDKLSLTEITLLARTTELAQAISEKTAMQLEVKATLNEIDRIRQVEGEGRSRENELQRKCKAAEEEARMADLVVLEYADLVRSLEGKLPKAHATSNAINATLSRVSTSKLPELESTTQPSDISQKNDDVESSPQAQSNRLIFSLTENRFSLQRLLHELNSETSSLQTEITRLHVELATVQARLDTEREISRLDRAKLAEALVEVERCKTDDQAAGKLVSRYMRFSQSSIDMLQAALSTLKSRHAATLATISSSSEAFTRALALERKRSVQLRDILDQLTEDISRETFGRRREVALRLRNVVREEKMVDALKGWLRRAEEHCARMTTITTLSADAFSPGQDLSSRLTTTLDRMIEDARALLASLSFADRLTTEPLETSSDANAVLVEHACKSLLSELQNETEKRLALTRATAAHLFVQPPTSSPIGGINEPHHVPTPSLDNTHPSSELIRTSPRTLEQCPDHCQSSPQEAARPTQSPSKHVHSSPVEPSNEITRIGEETNAVHPPLSLDSEGGTHLRSNLQLDGLTHVSHRYDQLQHAFRDCHLALAQLRAIVTSDLSSRPGISVVQNVIHRLDDFCEDARVELEIRMADEERITRGFETMLRVPGALVVGKEERARYELQSFVDGTAPSVIKALESYTSKLTDLLHDIAQIKRALHEIEAAYEDQVQPPETPPPKTPPVWSSWTPPFLSTSPTKSSSPAPTFGTVITAPRPRHVSSTSSFPFLPRASTESTPSTIDPYAHLGLHIPMPSQAPANLSPLHSSSFRLRDSRGSGGMYLLGLSGSRSGFLSKQESIEAKTSQGSEYDLDMVPGHTEVE